MALVVDVSNVLGSRPDGWWRDRRGSTARLVRRIERAHPDAICVLDPGADDAIVALVPSLEPPVTVVTSDRELAARCRALGASVRGAGGFRRALEAGGG